MSRYQPVTAWLVVAMLMVMATISLPGFARFIQHDFTGAWKHTPYDFKIFYLASQSLKTTGNIYSVEKGMYIYPPFLAFLISPLTLLDVGFAGIIWMVLILGALLTVVITITRQYFGKLPLTVLVLCQLSLVIFYVPLRREFTNGQVNLVLLAFLCIALYMFMKGKPVITGVFIGIGTSIKLVPIVFLMLFIVLKKWKTVISIVITIIILLMSPALITGFGDNFQLLRQWKDHVMLSSTKNDKIAGFIDISDESNQSLLGTTMRFFSISLTGNNDFPHVNYATWSYYQVKLFTLSIILFLVMVLSLIITRENRITQNRELILFVVFIPLMIILSPVSWVTHYVYLVLPLLVVLFELVICKNLKTSVLLVLVYLYSLILVCPSTLPSSHLYSKFLAHSSRLFGCFLLFTIIMVLFSKDKFSKIMAGTLMAGGIFLATITLFLPRSYMEFVKLGSTNVVKMTSVTKRLQGGRKGIRIPGIISRPGSKEKIVGRYKTGMVYLVDGIGSKDLDPLRVPGDLVNFTNPSNWNYLFKGFGSPSREKGVPCTSREIVLIFIRKNWHGVINMDFFLPMYKSGISIPGNFLELVHSASLNTEPLNVETRILTDPLRIQVVLGPVSLRDEEIIYSLNLIFNKMPRQLYLGNMGFVLSGNA